MKTSDFFTKKVYTMEELSVIVEDLKSAGKKSVFTNGCFDLLHRGHIQYLREARKLGDFLIVGLNSDDSVKRLKGCGRPINTATDRWDKHSAGILSERISAVSQKK